MNILYGFGLCLSLSGHKFYGPKGIGVLYLRQGANHAQFQPTCFGGKQENGLRPGTMNVPSIVGLGKAIEMCGANKAKHRETYKARTQKLLKTLTQELKGVSLNGHPEKRLPQNLSLSFDDVAGEDLQREATKYISASAGSACLSAGQSKSHVLEAKFLLENVFS
jgi:cysteine desulfurase